MKTKIAQVRLTSPTRLSPNGSGVGSRTGSRINSAGSIRSRSNKRSFRSGMEHSTSVIPAAHLQVMVSSAASVPSTSPAVVTQDGVFLMLQRLHLVVDCILDTVSVTIEGVWINNTSSACTCMFVMPLAHGASVTNACIETDTHSMDTAVLATSEVASIWRASGGQNEHEDTMPFRPWEPEFNVAARAQLAFRMPIFDAAPGAEVRVSMTYMERMEVDDGAYSVRVPLSLSFPMISHCGGDLLSLVAVDVFICTGSPLVIWGSSTHPLSIASRSDVGISLQLTPRMAIENRE